MSQSKAQSKAGTRRRLTKRQRWVRNIRKQLHRYHMNIKRSARKRRSSIRRFIKQTERRILRFRRNFKRLVKRNRRLLLAKIHPAKRRRSGKPLLHRLRLPVKSFWLRLSRFGVTIVWIVPVLIIVYVGGVFSAHQLWPKGSDSLSANSQRTLMEAPGRVTTVGPAQPNSQFSKYPTWSQDFTTIKSKRPNPKYWNIFHGVPKSDNQEAQYYTDHSANVHIDHSGLSLVGIHQPAPDGYDYTSARIDTDGKLSFLYGRIDVSAKLPAGVGTWPAIWFLPANTKYEDMSPSSDNLRYVNGGEIDMMEAVGFQPNVVYGVVHSRSDLKNPNQLGAFNDVTVAGNDMQYELYSVLWTPTSITFEVNNKPFFTYTKTAGANYTTWPFDQPFFMIINLALGGVWGGEDTLAYPGNGINNAALPATLSVRSVYYYPYTGQ